MIDKNEKEILTDKKYLYTLFESSDGSLYLSVMCGTIGLYEVKFKLNKKEIEEYKDKGKQAIDELSINVAKNSDVYLERST